jgi:hypothetical protein
MVKSKFNFDTYIFLIFKQFGNINFFVYFACMHDNYAFRLSFFMHALITYSRLSFPLSRVVVFFLK